MHFDKITFFFPFFGGVGGGVVSFTMFVLVLCNGFESVSRNYIAC